MSDPLSPTAAVTADKSAPTAVDPILSAKRRPAEVLRAFSRIRRTAALYGRQHPVIERLVGDAFHLISTLLADHHPVAIFIHEETFFVDNTILLEDSLQLASLLAEFRRRDILSLEIQRDLERDELWRFTDMLNMPATELQHHGGVAGYLAEQGVRHIVVGSVQANPLLPEAGLQVEPGDAYRAGLRVMDELYSQATSDSSLNLHKARVIVNSLIDILTKDRLSLMRAALIKNYDADTAHHSVNVGILALFMASRLEFDRDLTATLGLAALLHDIGKVRIPLEILTKAGRLTDAERKIMQQHPVYGAQMLRSLAGLSRLAMVVAFEHHANHDLSGYPRITTKTRPHLLARLVQIVDVFDAATTSRRAYRRAQAPDDAMRFIIAGTGTLYDPALTRIFTQEMGVYPVGTLVQLDGGALAVVRQPGQRDPTRPLVSVLDPHTAPAAILFDLNLEEHQGRHIVRSVDPSEAGVDVAAVQFPQV